ncbi:unnamed protein product [Durusdinium trenchii]|uniref:Uncharacterized protein n=1 Tax=Durusdinium trenchii TaxID=1381693 RepID=A0ABP0LFN6_9DINO
MSLAALRAVLRVAHRGSKAPSQLAPLLNRAARLWDPQAHRVVPHPLGNFVWCDELLRSCGNGTEYALPVADRRAVRAVRKHWHLCQSLGIPYMPQAEEALKRFQKATEMGELLRCHEVPELPATRWRLTWCAPSEEHQVEVGDLLITHPLSGLFQDAFDQGVLLVVKVNQEAKLIQALVLNKASEETLADQPSARGARLPNQPIFRGDAVWQPDLAYLHCQGDALGTTPLRLGLCSGGDLGQLQTPLRFFKGCAAWATEQLKIELERGVWVHARPGFHRGGQEALHGLALEASGSFAWRAALMAAGLPALATFPRSPEVDVQLKEYVTAHQRRLAMEMHQLHQQKGTLRTDFQASFRTISICVRLASGAPAKLSRYASLAPLADAPDVVEAWDTSTFRCIGRKRTAMDTKSFGSVVGQALLCHQSSPLPKQLVYTQGREEF